MDFIQTLIQKIETFLRKSRFFPFVAALVMAALRMAAHVAGRALSAVAALLGTLIAACRADRKIAFISGLSVVVIVLLIGMIRLSVMMAQPVVTQNAQAVVNLSSGPIIRTYEIGKTYKVQLLQAIAVSPDNILGVAARDLHVLFGNSSFIRQEGRASIWQYSNGACVLDIFFEGREDRSPDLAPAVHYEIRPTGAGNGSLDEAACVADLLKGHAGPYMVGVGAFYKAVMD